MLSDQELLYFIFMDEIETKEKEEKERETVQEEPPSRTNKDND